MKGEGLETAEGRGEEAVLVPVGAWSASPVEPLAIDGRGLWMSGLEPHARTGLAAAGGCCAPRLLPIGAVRSGPVDFLSAVASRVVLRRLFRAFLLL